MKISVKTLKGEQFQIEVEPSCKIAEVKEIIEQAKSEMPASRQKLIHSGKVLKDTQELSETGIAENEFLVCMLTKESKPKPQAMVNKTPTPPVSTPAPQVTQQQATTTTQSVPPTTMQQPTTPAPQLQTQTPNAPSRESNLNPEAIRQLMDMGFPEDEATTALRAAMGNADVAVEFLMNGIPPHALAAAGMGGDNQNTSLNESTDSMSGGSGIEQLRAHPQLNELRRIVQSNPSALSQVLEAIGQQNPALLQLIHANQAEFLAMMNEPITEDPPQQQQQQQSPPSHMPSGEPNPMQLIQMIQQLPEEQRAAAAQSLGMTPEQLQAFSQMISQLPPAELQALLGQFGQGRGGGGGGPPGGNVIRLSEEEMNSVNRLTELGFDQQDAVQAYLACDKNEALAANMLMDGWNNDDNFGEGGNGGN
jgi:UV excision repair protein RAD23